MSNMLSPISHSRIFTELRMINQTTVYKRNNSDFLISLIWWINRNKKSQYYPFGTLFRFLNELYKLSALVLSRLNYWDGLFSVAGWKLLVRKRRFCELVSLVSWFEGQCLCNEQKLVTPTKSVIKIIFGPCSVRLLFHWRKK